MKKFFLVVLMLLMYTMSFAAAAQVILVDNKTGSISVTGTACNLAAIQFYGLPANVTIYVIDSATVAGITGNSVTKCAFYADAVNEFRAATGVTAKRVSFYETPIWTSLASFTSLVKPSFISKTFTYGIVLKADADVNSVTADFFITTE